MLHTSAIRVLRDSILLSADTDYHVARWAAINHISNSYAWSSAQAIEKLLKFHLLANKVSLKSMKRFERHKTKALAELACSEGVFDDHSLEAKFPHALVQGKFTSVRLKQAATVWDFFEITDEIGDTNNRYFQNTNFRVDFSGVHVLDSVIKILRPLPDKKGAIIATGPFAKNLDEKWRRHQKIFPQKFQTKSVVDSMVFQNDEFFPEYFKRDSPIISGFSSRNSVFAALQEQASIIGSEKECKDLEWLFEHGLFPKEEHARQRSKMRKKE